MKIVTTRNVHRALIDGLNLLRIYGKVRDSRAGEVIVVEGPVTTRYTRPCERVIFWANRDANPFFHFFESLWMLAGRNDLEFLTRFVKTFGEFSDDGETLHGAYGHRWLRHFGNNGLDQLTVIIRRLKANPDDRRCVLQMWDVEVDLDRNGKDVPCNTQAYFSRDFNGRLDMTVCCRSNDMIWGGYGANAVHFSVLQEFIAAGIGCPVGHYWQLSNNYHAYTKLYNPLLEKLLVHENEDLDDNPYMTRMVSPYPLVQKSHVEWQEDCEHFCNTPEAAFRDKFFTNVAQPMYIAHLLYKDKKYVQALNTIDQVDATDWRMACQHWIARRRKAAERAKDDGPSYES